jgi:2-iminobutanoate/2-iminopropanoate deaminase
VKKIINSKHAPAPVGPYNQAILAGDTLYISGQIAIDASKGEIVNDSIENETKQVLENIKHILTEADMTLNNIVKCSVFVSDMKNYSKINEIYLSYFGEDNAPARELVEVAALPKYVNVEISAIAVILK